MRPSLQLIAFALLSILTACREVGSGTRHRDPTPPTSESEKPFDPLGDVKVSEGSAEWVRIQSRESASELLRRLRLQVPRLQELESRRDRRAFFGAHLERWPVSESLESNIREWLRSWGGLFENPQLVLELVERRELQQGNRFVFVFRQRLQNIEVEGSSVKLQVQRLDNEYVLNYVSYQLAPLPSAGIGDLRLSADEALFLIRDRGEYRDLDRWSEPRLVAFYDFQSSRPREARLAFRFQGRSGAERALSFTVDAENGSLLHLQNDSIHLNFSGTVRAYVTPEDYPDSEDYPAELEPLSGLYMEHSGGDTDITNSSGSYSLTDGGGGPDTVTASLIMPFDTGTEAAFVLDSGLNVVDLDRTATAPGVLDFIFNSSLTEELTAAANVFFSVEKAYRYFKDRAAFGNLDTQQLQLRVNRNTLPCNASYTPDGDDNNPAILQFNEETDACRNSSYSTIVVHEFGHHVVNRLGLTQLAFGEGFADSLSMLIYDTAGVGFDFQKDEDYLRAPGQIDARYPCDSTDPYTCGNVLSGLFWDIRTRIGLEDAQDLHVAWSQITSGGVVPAGLSEQNAAHPETIVEILTADDDDANLENGTPQMEEICEAAMQRGLECPVLLNFVPGATLPRVIPPGEVVTITMTVAAGLGTPSDDTAYIVYRINEGEWVSVALTSTGVNTYSFSFPVLREGDRIEYYFYAQTSNANTAYWHQDDPFDAVSEFPANSDVQVRIPRSIQRLVVAENPQNNSGGKILGFGDGLISLESTDVSNLDLTVSRLPDGSGMSSQSLFAFSQEATSTTFAFTDGAKRRVFIVENATGDFDADPKFCGEFSRIGAIYLTETAAGVRSRLIVADEGARKLYSFAIDTGNDNLCTSEASLNLSGIKWIRSNPANAPQEIFVGYQVGYSLFVTRLAANSLALVSGGERIVFKRGASFGDPGPSNLLGSQGYMAFPIRAANDPTRGADFIQFYDTNFTGSTVATCRSPDQVRWPGSGNLLYVLCRGAKLVDVIDLGTLERVAQIPAGPRPRDLLAALDGDGDTTLAISQSDSRLYLIEIPGGWTSLPSDAVTSVLTLPASAESMAHWNASDTLLALNPRQSQMYVVDYETATHEDTYMLPTQVNKMVAQSDDTFHFISSRQNRAFSFEEVDSQNWTLRQYPVGVYPVDIAYRPNRLYVANRQSDEVSIINLTTNSVSSTPTQDAPISLTLDTNVNQLWVANSGSNSMTTIDASTGGTEGDVIATTALGFSPKMIAYYHLPLAIQRTLFIAGGNRVSVLNQSDRASLQSLTFSKNVSSLFVTNSGAAALTKDNFGYHALDRTTVTSSTLSGSASSHAIGGSNIVLGMPNAKRIHHVGGGSFTVRPFSKLFQSSTHFAWYEPQGRRLRLSPFDLLNSSALNSFALNLAFEPDMSSSDGTNIWFADAETLSFQLVDSNLQPQRILNKLRNRAVAIEQGANDQVFIALRNINAVLEYIPSTGLMYAYAVCEGPTDLEYDGTTGYVYVLCPRGNMVKALDVAAGVITDSVNIAVGEYPVAMALNDNDRLFVANRDSESVSIINAQDFSTVDTLDLPAAPSDIFQSAGVAYVSVPNSREIQRITAGSVLADPAISTGIAGLKDLVFNAAESRLLAIASTPRSIFTDDVSYTFNNNLIGDSHPVRLDTVVGSSFAAASYRDADVVRIFNFDTDEVTDLSVGDAPRASLFLTAANRLYVSNYESDSISVFNTSNLSLVEEVDLTSGCGPTEMLTIDDGGTDYLLVLCDKVDAMEIVNIEADDHTVSVPLPLRIRD